LLHRGQERLTSRLLLARRELRDPVVLEGVALLVLRSRVHVSSHCQIMRWSVRRVNRQD
jgi:hypothetical protein